MANLPERVRSLKWNMTGRLFLARIAPQDIDYWPSDKLVLFLIYWTAHGFSWYSGGLSTSRQIFCSLIVHPRAPRIPPSPWPFSPPPNLRFPLLRRLKPVPLHSLAF
ncbi:hypothetical protein CLOM_g1788 [Closterium sp. NIES-68]|nr:hypothetical protein CLOM_g1788 [Closterium sp. NIES-68]GJP83355.1 hypothetical protein CLOP_g13517 [Closterium sp. NIES-67]